MIGTSKQSKKRLLRCVSGEKKEDNVPYICPDLLVWALVELGQRWVAIAVTLGELRGFE